MAWTPADMAKMRGLAVRRGNALRAAKRLLKLEYDGIIDCACRKDRTGKPILNTIDTGFRTLAARYRRVIREIDKALTCRK
jgi:hypothetical protein